MKKEMLETKSESVKLFESIQTNLKEDTGLKKFANEKDITDKFGSFTKFTPDMIEYVGDLKAGNCKQNAFQSHYADPEDNPDVYSGYIILKDKEGNLYGIEHYWNGNKTKAIEHTAVRNTPLYKKGELVYYIGEKVEGIQNNMKEAYVTVNYGAGEVTLNNGETIPAEDVTEENINQVKSLSFLCYYCEKPVKLGKQGIKNASGDEDPLDFITSEYKLCAKCARES